MAELDHSTHADSLRLSLDRTWIVGPQYMHVSAHLMAKTRKCRFVKCASTAKGGAGRSSGSTSISGCPGPKTVGLDWTLYRRSSQTEIRGHCCLEV